MASQDFRTPYTQQGDIAIERQLSKTLAITASYIWSRGLHLTSVNDINIGAPGPTVTYRINDASGNQVSSYTTPVYVRQNRVDTRYARINIIDAGLNSWYNGLAAQLRQAHEQRTYRICCVHMVSRYRRRPGRGGTPNIFASGGPQSYVPGDYRDEKGTSSLDIRHRLVVSAVCSPVFTTDTGALPSTW